MSAIVHDFNENQIQDLTAIELDEVGGGFLVALGAFALGFFVGTYGGDVVDGLIDGFNNDKQTDRG